MLFKIASPLDKCSENIPGCLFLPVQKTLNIEENNNKQTPHQTRRNKFSIRSFYIVAVTQTIRLDKTGLQEREIKTDDLYLFPCGGLTFKPGLK